MCALENKTSPMMEQWHRCKMNARGALLLFRLGDFYEAFYEDAHTVAKQLDITLTQRQGIPMSGVPACAIDNAIDKLISKGFLIAIAEQMEDPKATKGIVRREITRIISPATHLQSSTLQEKNSNFYAALARVNSTYGLALLDFATGEMITLEVESFKELLDELMRCSPLELLLSDRLYEQNKESLETLKNVFPLRIQSKEEWAFDHASSVNFLSSHFAVHNLDALGLKGMTAAINASGALLIHLSEELHQNLSHIKAITRETLGSTMAIDQATLRHLSILPDPLSKKAPSLLSLLDRTSTSMGSRLLAKWVTHPLFDLEEIKRRTDGVSELLEKAAHFAELLKTIRDLDRLTTRINMGLASPRDLISLAFSLKPILEVTSYLQSLSSPIFQEMLPFFFDPLPLIQKIEGDLENPPPAKLSEGGVFRKGRLPAVDELRSLKERSEEFLVETQTTLRETLGIKTLRVSYTRAFGYFIEVSKGQISKMPPHFERTQTLMNAERYTTKELKEYEQKILRAEEEMAALEELHFIALRNEVAKWADQIQLLSSKIAILDVLVSLSLVAKEQNYTRASLDMGDTVEIVEGRHPIIETITKEHGFIANNFSLGHDALLLLLTGPNMAGKSTYIRQVALIVILAQIGSFVPARKAHIGLVDKVFTRIGASDDLSKGQSTFMVEMTETANILRSATAKSLVILDEIGRGTSTYDGIAIASAVAEHLLTVIKAKTLFATHFWELTKLQEEYGRVKNSRVAVQENEDGIIFLHKILDGGTDKSYGIHVAKLAGLPSSVVQKAQKRLSDFKEKKSKASKCEQLLLFPEETKKSATKEALLEELSRLEIEKLTPLEALQILAKWKAWN
ncbi:MAG: DNA mismatch repair protein MutS [Verrucomicrobia bacterium]|nr:DNA mismatch repair protein MutS [Verrucomicrobiota bacterium]